MCNVLKVIKSNFTKLNQSTKNKYIEISLVYNIKGICQIHQNGNNILFYFILFNIV